MPSFVRPMFIMPSSANLHVFMTFYVSIHYKKYDPFSYRQYHVPKLDAKQTRTWPESDTGLYKLWTLNWTQKNRSGTIIIKSFNYSLSSPSSKKLVIFDYHTCELYQRRLAIELVEIDLRLWTLVENKQNWTQGYSLTPTRPKRPDLDPRQYPLVSKATTNRTRIGRKALRKGKEEKHRQ